MFFENTSIFARNVIQQRSQEGKGDLLSVGTFTSLTLALAVFRADAFHLKMEERTE